MTIYEPVNVSRWEIYGCGIAYHRNCTTDFNKVGASRNVYVCNSENKGKNHNIYVIPLFLDTEKQNIDNHSNF